MHVPAYPLCPAGSLCAAALLVSALLAPLSASAQTAPEPARAPAESDAPKDIAWQPVPEEMVDALLRAARVSKRDVLIDLGSGDGRFPIAAAKFGARAIGVEADAEMIAISRKRASEAGLGDRVEFKQGDLFAADLAPATVISVHLESQHKAKLRAKLLGLRPGTRIVGYQHGIEDWEPDELIDGADRKDPKGMIWIVPANAAGTWRVRLAEGRAPRDFDVVLAQRHQRLTGEVRIAGQPNEAVRNGVLRGDRLSFFLPSEPSERLFFAQVYGEVMTGVVTDGVRSVRFRGDRVGK